MFMGVNREALVTVRARDGIDIGCWRSGDGPPLVVVHGTSADHGRWRTVLEPLAARFTVYAMDRRGRGASGDVEPYAIENEFDDVAAVVDSMPEPAHLLGHSYGAICSLEAARRTTNLRSLVLYEPPLPIGIAIVSEATQAKLDALNAAGDREGVLETFMREVVRVPESDLATLRSLPAWQARIAAAHTIPREESLEHTYRFDPEWVREIHVPVLLLQGGESPPFLVEPIRVLERMLPDVRVVVMPGQQHAAMDTGTELFLKAVLDFLTMQTMR
jgi:pimeloyl-ACP methyl ester carboxylesterase